MRPWSNEKHVGLTHLGLIFKTWLGHTKWWLVSDLNDKSKCNVHTLTSKKSMLCGMRLVTITSQKYRSSSDPFIHILDFFLFLVGKLHCLHVVFFMDISCISNNLVATYKRKIINIETTLKPHDCTSNTC